MPTLHYKVDNDSDTGRLDIVLANSGIGFSRRKIRKIIDIGGVYVNGKRIRVASRYLRLGDLVTIEYLPGSINATKNSGFKITDKDILYDRNSILALNKPPGLNVHATRLQSINHAGALVKEWFKKNERSFEDLQLVHRLDKETSGVLLFANTETQATSLMGQFRERTVKKYYEALCFGKPKRDEFVVECQLSGIDKNLGTVKIVDKGGKSSYTRFKLLRYSNESNVSLMACFPRTGRSHQLRVHLASSGLPILGDKKYDKLTRNSVSTQIRELFSAHHMLHARQIEFFDEMDNQLVKLQADYPENFQKLLKTLYSGNLTTHNE